MACGCGCKELAFIIKGVLITIGVDVAMGLLIKWHDRQEQKMWRERFSRPEPLTPGRIYRCEPECAVAAKHAVPRGGSKISRWAKKWWGQFS